MPLAEPTRRLWSLIARHQPWSILGPLLVVQWLALAVFAVVATHNGWLYYQGGDQSYYWTDAHLLSQWTLPVALVGYAWSYLLIPVAFFAGSNVLSGLPVVIVLNALFLLPVALLCVYGIATRIAGRVFGYWAARALDRHPLRDDPHVRPALPREVRRHHAAAIARTDRPGGLPLDRRPARHRLAARPRPRHPRLDGRRPRRAGRRLRDRAQAVERALLRRCGALPAGRDAVGTDRPRSWPRSCPACSCSRSGSSAGWASSRPSRRWAAAVGAWPRSAPTRRSDPCSRRCTAT